jgi:hypothetical protein
MAVLIAVALALLPAARGVAPAAMAGETFPEAAGAAVLWTADAADVSDCARAHHGAPADSDAVLAQQGSAADHGCPSGNATGDCTMAGCAATCFNSVALLPSKPAFAPVDSMIQPVQASQVAASQIGSPPFRPPRS